MLRRAAPLPVVQPKLEVGAVDDPLEHEADRVAEQVLRMPAPKISAAPPQISRKCAACDDEDKVQRQAAGPGVAAGDAPTAVRQALSSSGRPLDAATRAYFEPRFGRDLGGVRVHTGASAERSARELNAHAYTVATDIVFGAGRFAPGSDDGRRLIAHELTHVIQQSGPAGVPAWDHGEADAPSISAGADGGRIRRFVPCEQPSLSADPCPPRQAGEIAGSATDQMSVHPTSWLSDVGDTITGYLIAGFQIDRSAVKADLKDVAEWKQLVALMKGSKIQWKLHGISDCSGSVDLNGRIRKARAQAIYDLLPPEAQANVVATEAAPLTDCMTGNQSRVDRTVNRSVLIEQVGRKVDIDPTEEAPLEANLPKFVCGPDVTSQVADAVRLTRTLFGGWNSDEREEACDALVSFRVGDCSWDILDLHNNDWINKGFQPTCATTGAPKGQECGESIQIDDDCHYAGSANYVIYGTMFKLCSDEDPSTFFSYSRSNMESFIDLYKGTGKSGLATPSANFKASLAWAKAGYDGWPSGGSPPSGDRNNCAPMCPLPYTRGPFDIHWYPHHSTETCGR